MKVSMYLCIFVLLHVFFCFCFTNIYLYASRRDYIEQRWWGEIK